jgi:uncharacterized Fe-S cluster-containing radical SAM superfamily enzyme
LSFASFTRFITSGISLIISGIELIIPRSMSGSSHSCIYCPAKARPLGVVRKALMSVSCRAS